MEWVGMREKKNLLTLVRGGVGMGMAGGARARSELMDAADAMIGEKGEEWIWQLRRGLVLVVERKGKGRVLGLKVRLRVRVWLRLRDFKVSSDDIADTFIFTQLRRIGIIGLTPPSFHSFPVVASGNGRRDRKPPVDTGTGQPTLGFNLHLSRLDLFLVQKSRNFEQKKKIRSRKSDSNNKCDKRCISSQCH